MLDTHSSPKPDSAEHVTDAVQAEQMYDPGTDDGATTEPSLGRRFLQPRTLISFALAAVIVFFVFRGLNINVSQVWTRVRAANPLLLLAGLAVYYFAIVLRGWRWQLMLKRVGVSLEHGLRTPTVASSSEMVVLSLFANCVVPARLGDAYRGFLLKQRSGASFGVGLGTILAERLIDVVVMVAMVVVAGVAVFGTHVPGRAEHAFLLGLAVVIIGIAGSIGLYLFRDHIEARIPERLTGHFRRVNKGIFDILARPAPFAAMGVAIWGLDGLRVFLVARALGTHISIQDATVVSLLSALVTIIPFTPAGLGIVEGFMIWILAQVGVGHDAAAAVALLDRSITYLSLIVVGLPMYAIHLKREATVVAARAAVRPETAT